MDTKTLYNRTAANWSRDEPDSVSDFTGRPFLLERLKTPVNHSILDLGCGEGYCARHLAKRGAKVLGIDLSEAMIDLALKMENETPLGIDYRVEDARDGDLGEQVFDSVLAAFLFNYLSLNDSLIVLEKVFNALKPGGLFLFTVPHPAFAFMCPSDTPPFYFNNEKLGYFSGGDQRFEGKIWKRSGSFLNVQMYHKTFGDYFHLLRSAGFTILPEVFDLGVTDEHLALDESFFSPLADKPLHLGFALEKAC
jgi:cyclopropane fatty-acyl-phospholipid synthase-like methyltransferase